MDALIEVVVSSMNTIDGNRNTGNLVTRKFDRKIKKKNTTFNIFHTDFAERTGADPH